jgi:hypothetical protein
LGCWILDAGYWILVKGKKPILDAGSWIKAKKKTDAGYWMLDKGREKNPKTDPRC